MSRSMSFPTLLVFVIVLVLSVPSFGQKDTGSIVGTVKDPTGALVTNAKVTVTDAERGPALTTTTNDAGEYVAGPLRGGRYTVTLQHPGFKQAVSVPVNLDVQERVAINVTLQVGQISEAVEVTGAAPLLETETSELGQVVDHKRVANLPLNAATSLNLPC
jgi:Carboxypeptidase regulatory-like domain